VVTTGGHQNLWDAWDRGTAGGNLAAIGRHGRARCGNRIKIISRLGYRLMAFLVDGDEDLVGQAPRITTFRAAECTESEEGLIQWKPTPAHKP
jgi:hypothetical protein